MLSKSQISLITALHQKKYRKEHQLFLVEGLKAITEFLNSKYALHSIFCVNNLTSNLLKLSVKQKVFEISELELKKISNLQQPQGVLAVFEIPEKLDFVENSVDDMVLVLDGIQDPGNLGTIIRTADWFNFRHILCSIDCVDIYNPKVVQATMGSLARVQVIYTELAPILKQTQLPIYGTLLNGDNIYSTNFKPKGYLVFGNEGNGISEEIISLITKRVTIPGGNNTESLNVAISAAICCAEIKRNILK
jgi:TrmH family RNA methyltransferase